MYSDKLTDEADWRNGIGAFRTKALERIQHLEAQVGMLMIRIKDLEVAPKAPHETIKMEDKL